MPLTINDCEQHLIHELGGLPSSDVRTLWLITQAGVQMVSLHPWRYLNRFTDGTSGNRIDFVSGQNYAALPTGFAEFIGVEKTNGLVNGFELTSYQDLVDMRVGTYPATAHKTYGALYWDTDANGIPVQRLALHPTPTANATNALTVAYRLGWTSPTNRDDKSYLFMPEYMETLYVAILRATAAAYEFRRMTINEAMAEVQTSPLLFNAIQRDASNQGNVGPLRNGAMTHAGAMMYSFYPSTATSDPS